MKKFPNDAAVIYTIGFFLLGAITFYQCSSSSNTQESYLKVEMPENANPESPYWKGIDLEPKPPVKPLAVEEQQSTFILPPGYKIEPVLTDPQIEQPGAITFDANGRMWVLELRSYMLTADSDNELDPISRISRWEDTDNDGYYETGSTFVDSLVFPRFVLPLGGNSVLTMESNQDNVYKYTDTDGDGKADIKEFFTGDFGRSGNVEHQQAFLYRGMDNWLYSTVNTFRVRETPNGVIRENTGFNHAQWGAVQDNEGKIWWQGGSSGLPSYFQFPVLYGNFKVEDQFEEGFDVPWGAPILLADMQGGMRAVRQPDGSLNKVTGASGNDVYRGHMWPEAMQGQYFYGEPVARIVRQCNPIVTEGVTQLKNYYQEWKSEFLKSTDPLFRPVDMATAPDGSMYVVDMYHGIIQEGQWAQKGSYLRAKIEQYQLDKVVSLGRIWRITYEGLGRDETQPRMLDETPSQIVEHLSHPNGIWRDLAQQELIYRGDTTVSPTLVDMALSHENKLARYHAMWTLEGLGTLSRAVIDKLFTDKDPDIRKMAIRVSETLYKNGDKGLGQDYLKFTNDPDFEVVIQAMMTLGFLKVDGREAAIKSAMNRYPERGVQIVGKEVLNPTARPGFFAPRTEYSEEEQVVINQGQEIYNELCITCHGEQGTGVPVGDMLMAPSLSNSTRMVDHPDYLLKVVLRGLMGEIEGTTYTGGIMVPMADNSDEWVAAVASFVRTNFGNDASVVSPEEVAAVRASTEGQAPYQFHDLISTSIRKLVPNPDTWNVTASHSGLARIGGTGKPYGAFTFEGWTSEEKQDAGMWFQLELPADVQFTELEFESPEIRRGFRRNGPPPLQTHPRQYEIHVSTDGTNWGDPIFSGAGTERRTHVKFNPAAGRFIRITQTEPLDPENDDAAPWKMENLKIFAIQPMESS